MTEHDLLRQIEALETRLERRLNAGAEPILRALDRIERKVDKTNGRVTRLEEYRLTTESAERTRTQARKEASELALKTAEQAVQARERSRKWWLGRGTLVLLAFSTATPVMGALLRALHVIH